VAEVVFGMAVMAARNMYAGTSGIELKGKRLGIQAFGAVGRNVARIAQGFGMEVSALDPYCPDEAMEKAGVATVHDINALYSDNLFVSIHIPATAETIGSIGYDLITRMPKGAVLINTARKEVIDEAGLARALADRADLKYVADVAPTNAAELIEKFAGRVFFTPKKMGAQTAEANINAGIAAANQVVAFLRDGVDRFRVN
jgi:D-3-phosphoglycerate dehydrogenase